jgi:GGDEF domain-containing protein
VYEVLPSQLAAVMGHPVLLILPKFLNVAAGSVVLCLLLWRWLPLAVTERSQAERRASDLETLAAVDFLTGVYNRRHFETLARAELARYQRYMRPLSVMMIDIDHFKTVNDQFGHAVGDRVLKSVADLCRAAKRDTDIVARVGGEEFAIMLPKTTEAATMQFCRAAVPPGPRLHTCSGRGGNPRHDQRRDCRRQHADVGNRVADARRRSRAVSSETLRPRSDRSGEPR